MPRTGRVDSPGAIQHLLVRGLERRRLFKDVKDYGEFTRRLSGALEDTGARCLGWALMPNHVHLVTRTGHRSISKMMQILLSGYGLYFNRRYKRSGYLYQGRFKSLLVEEEGYFLVLVRYVHLNPLKGGVVQSLAALDRYRWAGHAVLLGKRKASWQETAEVLGRFGRTRRSQRKAYRTFVREGLKDPMEMDWGGLRLMRALGGLWEREESRSSLRNRVGQESVLGTEVFVEKSIKLAGELEDRRQRLLRKGWTLEKVLQRAASCVGLKARDLRGNSKEPAKSLGRALVCKWLVEDLGWTTVKAARKLRISQPTVTQCVQRGRTVEKKSNWRLEGSRGVRKP